QEQLRILADISISAVERVKALLFVVHLVGDLEQPLHNAERQSDKGGNEVSVRFFGLKKNLHEVWDDGILQRALKTDASARAGILDVSETRAASWKTGSVED